MHTERPQRPHGILVVDKPQGPTSHDVVGRIRKALGTREAGHAGTLDPMATGVLVVALGEATKLMPWLTHHDKVYSACVALGVETDTCDAWGVETRTIKPSRALRAALQASRDGDTSPLVAAALDGERARTSQIPPAYSAIHCEGERAYERARRGAPTELAPRAVQVHDLMLLQCSEDPPTLTVIARVSKGYYIRALARDLGTALGTVAHLTSLRRTRSGDFSVERAVSVDASPEALREGILPLAEAAARALPIACLTQKGAEDARHGRLVAPEHIGASMAGPCAWIDPTGQLVAVGHVADEGGGRVIRGFRATRELET